MDGTFKTYTSLWGNPNQADLEFLIFGQRNRIVTVLCNFLVPKVKISF